MIGKEIADAIAPFVQWFFIVGGVILVLVLIVRKWNQGVVARDDIEEAGQAEEDRQDATSDIKKNRRRLRDIFNRSLSDD